MTDLRLGQRVVVRTPDRRVWQGLLVEVQERPDGRQFAVVRLDSGWITSYPLTMVHSEVKHQ